jgi:hypothetical protein
MGIGQLLAAGLDCEILLCEGNFRLAGVAVLGDQIAGEAGKVEIDDLLNRTVASDDRFARAQSDAPDRSRTFRTM